MELQFYGANCLTITSKQVRITVDDNLAELGAKPVVKANDVAIFTTESYKIPNQALKLLIAGPGEYEVGDVSIQGFAVRAHMDPAGKRSATLYKLSSADLSVVITGHVYPELSDGELEDIGLVDVLCIPVGGNGYTLDAIGALTLIKKIEPKIVVPTHYDDKSLNYPVPQVSLEEALKNLAMEPKEKVTKLKLKANDLSDDTQLIVLGSQ